MTINNQFYPTPSHLAIKAFHKFKNKEVVRMLEPSAGRGDLIEHLTRNKHSWSGHHFPIDCIEIDLDNQAILREGGYNVIDGNFMAYNGRGAMYSHIFMNPPFNAGAKHLLKAWHLLYAGEVVAIVNAGTIRNPTTEQEKVLKWVIDNNGDVEFLEEQFTTSDTERKTKVEIALVHLVKTRSLKDDNWQMPLPDQTNMSEDDGLPPVNEVNRQQLAISEPVIKAMVRAFILAVEKIKYAEMAEDEARYYEGLLWSAFSGEMKPEDGSVKTVSSSVNDRYIKLRESAWRKVLTTSQFTDRLSSEAQKRLESQFEQVSRMEFTESNIYGLLSGLVAQKGQMDAEMMCDVFDLISRYHTENRAYYRGWKSNDKHRKHAYRLKMTRFILHVGNTGWGIDWNKVQEIADIEKVFGLMDGKTGTDLTMVTMLRDKYSEVKDSSRYHTKYFDFRYYPGAGTLHVFPQRKELVDRLNRTVGRVRKWLPDEQHQSDPHFWKQYKQAEKVTQRMDKLDKGRRMHRWDNSPVGELHEEACKDLGLAVCGNQLSWAGESVALLEDN